MNYEFRITDELLKAVRLDLERPHEFAFERVGFIHCNNSVNKKLILATSYGPVGDSKYIPDRFVGAKFSGEEIRAVMEYSLQTKQSIFHVHLHEHLGEPELSKVDQKSIIEITNSVTEVNPSVRHGCILLSDNHCKAYLLSESRKELVQIKATVVGFPIQIFSKEAL